MTHQYSSFQTQMHKSIAKITRHRDSSKYQKVQRRQRKKIEKAKQGVEVSYCPPCALLCLQKYHTFCCFLQHGSFNRLCKLICRNLQWRRMLMRQGDTPFLLGRLVLCSKPIIYSQTEAGQPSTNTVSKPGETMTFSPALHTPFAAITSWKTPFSLAYTH